ncbi:three-helix bundle dimerization domain-containing protein [Spirillospora sp. CA-255316]
MAHQGDNRLSGYEEVGDRLTEEFAGVHPPETVARCVAAARHGAQEVTGGAAPDLVERIARKHLQVLAVVAAEKRRRSPRSSLGNAP